MDLAGEAKKQPFWQHGGTILVDSQAATIKGHYDMWLNWLPILHRHTSCGSPIMHGVQTQDCNCLKELLSQWSRKKIGI
jgi:hypothetical protein